MSHGVHRGNLKKGKTDNREIFINKLINKNKNLKFDVYGMNNVQPIWGENFISKISNSYMGINLSRGKPIKYYSSDRIVQLVGNGLLTFIDKNTFLSDFFSSNEIISTSTGLGYSISEAKVGSNDFHTYDFSLRLNLAFPWAYISIGDALSFNDYIHRDTSVISNIKEQSNDSKLEVELCFSL